MSVTIRETNEKDFREIDRLLSQSSLKDASFTKEKFKRMLKRCKGACYVAEDAGVIIGNAFGMHDGAFSGYIRKVVVDKNSRRKGIASALMNAIIKKFQKEGIPVAFVHAAKENSASHRLFESLGFEERHTHVIFDKGYEKR